MFHALLLSAVAQVTPPPTPPPLVVPSPPVGGASAQPAATPQATSSPSPSPLPSVPGARLTLSAASVRLNPAQQIVVMVSGASPPLQATLERKLVSVRVSPDATSVTIAASQATGSDVLHLTDANGATADVGIRVAFNAGTIAPQTTLQVSGNPIGLNWLARQIAAWVGRATQAQPGAVVTIANPVVPPVPIAPGGAFHVSVPVHIAGQGQYFDRSGATVVNVQNVALPAFVPSVLFYDDDPERLTQDGVLFRGTVTSAQPTRLYYYHDDDLDPRRILVAIASDSQDPTSVELTGAMGGPNIDVLHVGNALTKDFLVNKTRNEAIVVDIPQDQPFWFENVGLSARDDVAGTVDLRVLSGGPVVVTVLAVSAGADPRALLDQPPVPGDGHARHGIFQLTGYGNDTLSYTAGGSDDQVAIGDGSPPAASADPKMRWHDYGDYGVTQTIDVTMTNPTIAPATAYLYFEPLGGVARGSFLVDGRVVDLGCVRESVPYQIAAYTLAAGQTYRSVVTTMTDGGSFYPVEIGVTGTPPDPTTPPVDAPDGCYPQ